MQRKPDEWILFDENIGISQTRCLIGSEYYSDIILQSLTTLTL